MSIVSRPYCCSTRGLFVIEAIAGRGSSAKHKDPRRRRQNTTSNGSGSY